MKITIDGIVCEAESGEYLIHVARRNGIEIPTLCHHDALPGLACCRLCLVEVIDGGWPKIVVSCVYPVTEDMEALTNTEKIRKLRKGILQMLRQRAPAATKLDALCTEYGAVADERFITDANEKCIMCGLCAKACATLGNMAITTSMRGTLKKVTTAFDAPAPECVGCGSCARVCPMSAIDIQEKDGERVIWGKTFSMVKCECCGQPFATPEQINAIAQKGVLFMDGHVLCQICRKRAVVENINSF